MGEDGDGALGDGRIGNAPALVPLLHLQGLLVLDLVLQGLGGEFPLQLHGELHARQAGAALSGGGGSRADFLLHVFLGQGIELCEKHTFNPPILYGFSWFRF